MKKLLLLVGIIVCASGCFHAKSTDKESLATIENKKDPKFNQLFTQWLGFRKSEKYNNKEKQVENFIVENQLLKQQHILDEKEQQKIEFINYLQTQTEVVRLVKKSINDQIKPSPSEVKERFDLLKNKKQKPERYRLYQIYKRYPPNVDTLTKSNIKLQMEKIKSSIKSLDDFKKIATEESQSQSRLRKGLIGNVYRGILNPEIESIVFSMKPGEISEVINGEQGLMLFYCEKIIPAVIKTETELQEMAYSQIKKKLINEKWKALKENSALKNQSQKYSNQEHMLWLMSGLKEGKSLDDFNPKTVKEKYDMYMFNKDLFDWLSVDQKYYITQLEKNSLRQLMAQQIMVKLIGQEMRPFSESELTAYYNQNLNRYKHPVNFEMSGIAHKFNPKNRVAAFQYMENIHFHLAEETTTFADVANEVSAFSDKFSNGYMGFISRKKLSRMFGLEVLKATLKLSDGEMSDLIETDSGYIWIIKLHQKTPSTLMTFDESRGQLDNDYGRKLVLEIEQKIRSLILKKLLQK